MKEKKLIKNHPGKQIIKKKKKILAANHKIKCLMILWGIVNMEQLLMLL